MPAEKLAILGGRVIDPSQGIDRNADVLVADGRVEVITSQPGEAPAGYRPVDASGLVVAPGFVDLHTHLREPGQEWKETIATGTRAAARGGFTTVCAMPNTIPAQDSASVIQDVMRRASESGSVRVLPIGAITVGRKGKQLAPMAELAEAGVVAFSDDGDPVVDANLMRQALSYAGSLGLPVANHAEDHSIGHGGVMHEGMVSARLGLAGTPAEAEATMVARDLHLAELTGAPVHVLHVSTRLAVEHIRAAKARGVRVTAEATPHHLTMTDSWVYGCRGTVPATIGEEAYDTNSRVNPPLRSETDRLAVVRALADGTIDAIATDHAPHGPTDKQVTFNEASAGINNIETAFGSVATLVHEDTISLPELIRRLTTGPASAIGSQLGTLRKGADADIVLVDMDREWTVDPAKFASLTRNTPLAGVQFKGLVVMTIFGGKVVHDIDRKGA
jgi:dihydroorotase